MNNMYRYLILLLVLVFSKPIIAQTVSPFYEDGNIYIKVKAEALVNVQINKHGIEEFPFLNNFDQSFTVAEFRHLYAFVKHKGLENIYKISIVDYQLIDQAVAQLSKLDELEYAEKVPYKTYFATPPNDTSYNNTLQWNLFKINAQIAWNFIGSPTPSQAIIAIVDDGLDINHIDLKNNLWVNDLEMNGLPGVDDDGNFVVDDSLGYDFGNFDSDASPNDLTWHHGTHVSGIAGAVTNNVTGVASIGYNARLMAVKGSSSNLFVSNGFEAVAYAADNGADVINLSWGSPVESITEANTILYAHFLNAVVVAAAGNSNDATVNYPAAYPHVISVASTSSNDTKAVGTTYGQWIDVSAPGVNIYSTIPGNGFGLLSGTSMASPLVAGLVGLMRAFNPLLTPEQIEDCIKNNVDNIDFMNPNFPGKLGAGRINAFKTMQCVNATRNQIDASLTSFNAPNSYTCSSIFTPKIGFKNSGTTNLQSLTIHYKIDGVTMSPLNWIGNMEYDSLQYMELPTIATTSGIHTIEAFCTNPNGMIDWNFLNDTIYTTFELFNAGLSLPFLEDFENGLENKSWRISNPDQDKTWQVKSGTLNSTPNKAAFINLFNYPDKGQRDGLITPPLNFSGYDSITLQFDHAWKRNFRQLTDTLIIYASTDCGATFSTRLASFYQDTLALFATVADTMDVYFNPTQSSSWCGNLANCIQLDLSALAGNSSVLLKFETYNNFNNNLLIDNINISGTSNATVAPAGNSFNANTNSICAGDVVTFIAIDPNNNTTQWNWTFANGVPASASGQSVSIQFNTSGTVNASLVVGNNIGNTNLSLASAITINPLPNVNIIQNDTAICADNSIQLNVNGANTYFWSPSIGLSDSTGNLVTATPLAPVTYTVTGTSSEGCVNYDAVTIDTTVCLGLNSASLELNYSLYYNSTNGYITLKTGDTEIKNHLLSVYNTLGQIIYQININQNSGTSKSIIDCSAISNGVYFVAISADNRRLRTEKILVYQP